MAASFFQKLRGGDPQQSRTQDNLGQVLNPLAQAVMNTPIMGAPPPGWIAPSLVNGFANTGGLLAVAGFHVDALGYLHSKGALTHAAGTAAGTGAFTLPMGCRPKETQRFSVRGTAGAVQFVTVTAAGLVSNGLVLAVGGTIDLAFTFLAEQ